MWFLTKLDCSEGDNYPLYTRSEHIIGRFGNLDLSGDASVSRRHACIRITLQKGKVKLSLSDLGSKYGTYVNDGITLMKPLPKSTPVELKIGDQIRFGMQSNTWILGESQLVICTSMLSSQDKVNLSNIVKQFNGDIVSNWTLDCTHLTMTQLKTSVKAICALAHVKPIVSIEYWRHFASAFSKSVETPLPDCDDFLPPIAEPQLKSMRINMKMSKCRRTIFQGFKFIVFGRSQLNNVLPMVEAAGGTAVDGNRFDFSENDLCGDKVVVVQNNVNEACSSNALQVLNILSSRGLRAVRETEICLSIAECSTERYCNPRYDASILLRPFESETEVKSESAVLAVETQETQDNENTQFLETASGNFSLNVNEKNVFSESEDEDSIVDSDRSIISNTPPNSSAFKRKLPFAVENTFKAKNAKLDNWLLNKKVTSKDTNESLMSESVFSIPSKTNKKNLKDLFSFPVAKKDNDKGSSSLFGTNNESVPQSVTVAKDKPNKLLRSTTLFASTTCKPFEADNNKVDRPQRLHSDLKTPRTTPNSSKSFQPNEKNTLSHNSNLGKRKYQDLTDGETKSSKCANLFERQTNRPNAIPGNVILDSDDESELIVSKTSKLAIENDVIASRDSPINIPSIVSLSQFQSAPAKENVMRIKSEANNSVEVIHDKSIVVTVPLVESNVQNIQSRLADNSAANFKKFRKNLVCYPSSSTLNGSKVILFTGTVNSMNGFHDD